MFINDLGDKAGFGVYNSCHSPKVSRLCPGFSGVFVRVKQEQQTVITILTTTIAIQHKSWREVPTKVTPFTSTLLGTRHESDGEDNSLKYFTVFCHEEQSV